jgi:hypothetical protein
MGSEMPKIYNLEHSEPTAALGDKTLTPQMHEPLLGFKEMPFHFRWKMKD